MWRPRRKLIFMGTGLSSVTGPIEEDLYPHIKENKFDRPYGVGSDPNKSAPARHHLIDLWDSGDTKR